MDLPELEALGIRNDAISSIKVAPGYKVVSYADSGFRGRHVSLWDNMPCFSNFNHLMDLDNSLSSLEVQQVQMPSDVESPGE
jgi:hypothetical protein